MRITVNVPWSQIGAKADAAVNKAMRAAALKVKQVAERNIQDKDLVDTGAMSNAMFITGGGMEERAEAIASANDLNPGHLAEPRPAPAKNEMQVNNAMEYATYTETTHPWLAPAALEVSKNVPALVKKALSEVGL